MRRLLYETDSKGKVTQGSYGKLLEAVQNGADLKLGAATANYEEVIYFKSVIITKDNIIGIQPFHTSWNPRDTQEVPYRTSFMISTDRKDCFVRYNIVGGQRNLCASQSRGRYNYYRWFVEDEFVYVNGFGDKDGGKEKFINRFIEKSGNDIKISFQLKGITYIFKPYILIFPKLGISRQEITFANIRTYPTLLMDDGECSDIHNWKKLNMVEAFITYPDKIAILDFRQFKRIITIQDMILNLVKKVFIASPYTSGNIRKIQLKGHIEWFLRLNKEECLEYRKLIGAPMKSDYNNARIIDNIAKIPVQLTKEEIISH